MGFSHRRLLHWEALLMGFGRLLDAGGSLESKRIFEGKLKTKVTKTKLKATFSHLSQSNIFSQTTL